MISPKNIIRHELIGLHVKVVDGSNKASTGITGKVVDETKNTLIIKTQKGEKKVQKKYSKFMFTLAESKVIVDGSLLVARPEDRVKKKVKKW